ncbi:hypothetical protein AB0G79_09460 [Streptomyces sp. NPDC020807]|uniref:hypothetical protein n=1 Tax=Streptomyces sp. NPDC020807 TaxID=3155119 RepID=UPI0033C44AD9
MSRRARVTASLCGLLLPLTACGIQGTDVVEAGGAATAGVNIPDEWPLLYFVGPDGTSMPVVRGGGLPFDGSGEVRSGPGLADPTRTDPSGHGPVATDKVLAALLAGPRPDEVTAGLTTALPRGAGSPHVSEDESGGTDDRRLLLLRAPFPVTGLSAAAVRQLVCTTVHAEDGTGRAEVTVTGPDGALPTATCEHGRKID